MSQTRTCTNGMLSGSYQYLSCAQNTGGQCPALTRNLSRGARGADVTRLQTYLIGKGHLAAGNNTGYYGPLTETAVKKFQCAKGIICRGTPATTGYGNVGPRTRAALNQCN